MIFPAASRIGWFFFPFDDRTLKAFDKRWKTKKLSSCIAEHLYRVFEGLLSPFSIGEKIVDWSFSILVF